jgi:hypothetical protein
VKNLKKTKVLWDTPDYNGRDSNSMDMKNYIKSGTLILFCFVLLQGSSPSIFATTKKSNHGYLSFHAPPKLIFHEVPATADRSNLLRLGSPVSSVVEITFSEDNSSAEVSEFPLTSYDGEELPLTLNETTEVLPPADPFVDYTMESSNIDSTDQLIQIFENMEKSGRPSSRSTVNFIPPYTLDSGNFSIESRSSYTRRVRP